MSPLIDLSEGPIDVGRDDARRAAEAELARPEYQELRPALPTRLLVWLLREIGEFIDHAAQRSPYGYLGLVALAVVAVLLVIAMRLALGRVGRSSAGAAQLFGGRPMTAAEHRGAADAHADAEEWAAAVRERLRAVLRELEERDLLEPRPGRTAAEVAAEAGRVLPGCADQLRSAAATFAEVWYGGRPADRSTDARLRELDDVVRRARPELDDTGPRR